MSFNESEVIFMLRKDLNIHILKNKKDDDPYEWTPKRFLKDMSYVLECQERYWEERDKMSYEELNKKIKIS